MSRRNGIDIQEISSITSALSHFNGLASYLPQLDSKDPILQKYIQDLLSEYSVKHWYELPFDNWNVIDFHVALQMWGSTSCGWGGMGGSAMTESYTVVIENRSLGIAAIYWNGQLAYLVQIDTKYEGYLKVRGYKMPSRSDVQSQLTLIYKTTR